MIRSPTHEPHPDFGGCEFDECEIIGVVFFVTGGDGSEVFELVEEALDEVAVSVEEPAERWWSEPAGHGFHIGPGTACRERLAHEVAVIGPVGEQRLAVADAVEHAGGAAAVMGLALGQFEADGQAMGIDERVDLGGQPAPRAPRASAVSCVPSGGSVGVRRASLLPLAPC